MGDDSDYSFFKVHKEGKTYISKIFSFNERNPAHVRQVKMVMGSDKVLLGEIHGAMCLRGTGEKQKTQVSVLVTQDDRG